MLDMITIMNLIFPHSVILLGRGKGKGSGT